MRYCGSTFKNVESTFTSGADNLIIVFYTVTGVSENEHREYFRIFSFLEERGKPWDHASSEGYHMQILKFTKFYIHIIPPHYISIFYHV
jgi:hypothetical protein